MKQEQLCKEEETGHPPPPFPRGLSPSHTHLPLISPPPPAHTHPMPFSPVCSDAPSSLELAPTSHSARTSRSVKPRSFVATARPRGPTQRPRVGTCARCEVRACMLLSKRL
jgi:hypothetical protein